MLKTYKNYNSITAAQLPKSAKSKTLIDLSKELSKIKKCRLPYPSLFDDTNPTHKRGTRFSQKIVFFTVFQSNGRDEIYC